MKVIFLDFDGVINDIRKKDVLVVKEFVLNLKQIVECTDAKIVVISSRKNEFVEKQNLNHKETFYYQNFEIPLKNMGIEIYDYTPFLNSDNYVEKEVEVEFYLREHPEIEEYVILDDDMVMHKFLDHQVFVEYSNGLLEEHIRPAIAILNGKLGFFPPNYNINETLEERTFRIFGTKLFGSDLANVEMEELNAKLSLYKFNKKE